MGCSLSAEHAGSTHKVKKSHCCHPICFHWQKRLEQEKLQVLILGRAHPWPGREQSLFRQIERAHAAGKSCLFNCLSLPLPAPPAFHYSLAESSAPASRRHTQLGGQPIEMTTCGIYLRHSLHKTFKCKMASKSRAGVKKYVPDIHRHLHYELHSCLKQLKANATCVKTIF